MTRKGTKTIDLREMFAHFKRIAALGKDARRQAIAEALTIYGMRFIQFLAEGEKQAPPEWTQALGEVSEEASDLLLRWIAGEKISNRADEMDRRARAALELMGRHEQFARLAAISLLKLPEDHPLRDLKEIRAALERHAANSERNQDWEALVKSLVDLLTEDLLDEEECIATEARLLALPDANLEPDVNLLRLRAAGAWRLKAAVGAREENSPMRAVHLAAARAHIEKVLELDDSEKPRFQLAWCLEEEDRHEEAAEQFKKVVDGRGRLHKEAAWIEGMIRVGLGQGKRAIEVLELVVPEQEAEYVAALDGAPDASDWSNYAKNSVNLTFAYALEGRGAEALAAVERVKSARVRHAAKLRRTPEGRKLLRLEAAIAGARRGAAGVPDVKVDERVDPLGAHIQREARLLEKYRAARPALAVSTLAAPSVAEVAANLGPDEALISLASGFPGLLVILITANDRDIPSACRILPELPQDKVLGLMGGSDGANPTGWLLELAALDPVDPEPALLEMIGKADRELGAKLRAMLPPGVRRLHLIPHRTLHALPFWALPGFSGIDVRVASSLAEWYEARRVTPKLLRRSMCIGDPGENLPFARIEAGSVHGKLLAQGWQSKFIAGARATEGRVRRESRGAGLLHFAGHGFAKASHPLLSSLLLHPDLKWQWPRKGDPLARLAKAARTWREMDGGRYADTPRGRLIEWLGDSGVVERRLEHSLSGTLWARYDDEGKLLMCAELWSAGDLLFEGGLERCALAFLGACESGRPPLCFEVDEMVWLPSSLRVVGVGTIVCTLWAIAEMPALLFSRLFYQRIHASEPGLLDIAGIVGECRERLATLTAAETVAMLREIEATIPDAKGRKLLRDARRDLEGFDGPPFAHPYHWAAFHVVGCPNLVLAKPGRAVKPKTPRRTQIGSRRRARLKSAP